MTDHDGNSLDFMKQTALSSIFDAAEKRDVLTLFLSERVPLLSIFLADRSIRSRLLALRIELRLRAATRFYREESAPKALLFLFLERLLDVRQEGWRLDSVLSRRLSERKFWEFQ